MFIAIDLKLIYEINNTNSGASIRVSDKDNTDTDSRRSR